MFAMNSKYNHGHNILRLFEERSVIISNKHYINDLPYESPNDLRLRILRNWEISTKAQKFKEL